MEKVLINKKSIRKNRTVKLASKSVKKYYGRKSINTCGNTPKAKIGKLVNITDIGYVDLCGDNYSNIYNNSNPPKTAYNIKSKEDLISLCEVHDFTGRSGNGFKTAAKLKEYNAENGLLLVNGVECDPGLCHDAWIYRNMHNEVIQAVEVLDSLYGFKRIVIATKEPLNPDFDNAKIEEAKVSDRFPLGYEKYLIKDIFGIELSKDQLPVKEGILVLNIQTLLAIYEAMNSKNAGEYRYLTVLDSVNAKGYTVKSPIGMNISQVAMNVLKPEADLINSRIYCGGGLFMCHEAENDEKVKAETCFIAIGNMPDYEKAHNCVGCGKCKKNCPAGVDVKGIVGYYEKNGKLDKEECRKYNYEACIGCGACTYFCGAGKDTRALVAILNSKN